MVISLIAGGVTGYLSAVMNFRLGSIGGGFDSSMQERRRWRVKVFSFSVIVFVIVALSFLYVLTSRANYIVRGTVYLDQLQSIVAPFIDGEQRIRYRSRISQMSGRDEFIIITNELSAIARDNKAILPEFSTF